jgi:hypothetical protein
MFRGNSLGTKVIDMYMKMVGLDYLNYVLGQPVSDVMADRESCEVDPMRLGRGEDLKRNQKRLIAYCKAFLEQIANSVKRCPEYDVHESVSLCMCMDVRVSLSVCLCMWRGLEGNSP